MEPTVVDGKSLLSIQYRCENLITIKLIIMWLKFPQIFNQAAKKVSPKA